MRGFRVEYKTGTLLDFLQYHKYFFSTFVSYDSNTITLTIARVFFDDPFILVTRDLIKEKDRNLYNPNIYQEEFLRLLKDEQFCRMHYRHSTKHAGFLEIFIDNLNQWNFVDKVSNEKV